jgi:hypothetical protein
LFEEKVRNNYTNNIIIFNEVTDSMNQIHVGEYKGNV